MDLMERGYKEIDWIHLAHDSVHCLDPVHIK